MKQASLKRPHCSAFRRKWWQLIVMMLAFTSAAAQDSSRYAPINGYGFRYKRHVVDSVMLVPYYESPHVPYRAGAIKYRRSDSSFYKYTGTQWLKVNEGGSSSPGIDTVYTQDDTIQVIVTPSETYYTIINSPFTAVLNDSTIVIGNDTLVIKGGASGGGGSGSVTSITQGDGIILTPNPITSTGTIRRDTTGANGTVTRSELKDSLKYRTEPLKPLYLRLAATGTVTDSLDFLLGYGLMRNAGDSAARIDSSKFVTRDYDQKGKDSLGAIKYNISDTATGFNPYVRGSGTANQIAYFNATRSIASDPGITVDAATNKINSDTTNQYRGHVSEVLMNAKDNIITPPDSIVNFGNSFTAGVNASVPDSAYVEMLSRYWNVTNYNHAVSGRGIWKSIEQHNLNINTGHKALSTVMAGYNDIRRNSYNRRTLNKIIDGHKAIFVNQYAKTWVAAGNGSGVTRYGTWTTNYASSSVGGKSVANGAYTSTVSDSITFVFTDSTVYFTGIGSDQSGGAFNYTDSADVYIDNVFKERISEANRWDAVTDGSYDNKRGPMAWFYRGLTYGAHTLKIINRHSGNLMVIDGFGTLVTKQNAQPMIWYHAAYDNITGFAVSPANGSVRGMDSANAKIDSLWNTLPRWYPVFVAHTNNYLDTLTGISGDNIHPNDIGMRQLFNAGIAAYDLLQGTQNGLVEYDGTYYYVTALGVRRRLATTEIAPVDTTHFIYNNPSVQQTGFYNVSGASTVGNKLTIGSTALTGGSPSLINTATSGFVFRTYQFGSKFYNIWSDNGLNTGNSTILMAGRLAVSRLNGGGETEYAVFDQSATYKLSLVGGYTNTTGDNLFNSSSGNFGIGTAPSAKLHVSGSTRFDLGSDAAGDMFYRSSNNLTRLGIGAAGQYMRVNSGATAPEWANPNYEMPYSDLTTTTIANTTTETTLYGTGAGTAQFSNITAGSVLRLEGFGRLSTGTTPNAPTIECTIGTVTIAIALSSFEGTLTNANYRYKFELVPKATGTNQDAFYTITFEVMTLSGTSWRVYSSSAEVSGSFTTTGTPAADVTWTWGNADASNTISAYKNTVEILRK